MYDGVPRAVARSKGKVDKHSHRPGNHHLYATHLRFGEERYPSVMLEMINEALPAGMEDSMISNEDGGSQNPRAS